MLDRTTTAASQCGEKTARGGVDLRLRRIVLAAAACGGALVSIYLSRRYSSLAAEFRESSTGAATSLMPVDRFFDLVHRQLPRPDPGVQGRHQLGPAEPAARAAGTVTVVAHGLAIVALAAVIGGLRAVVTTVLCLAGLLLPRPVARLDGHLDHGPGGHPAGDDARRRLRRVDGAEPQGRPGSAPPARRRPDHPAVRLPDPGAGALRPDPIHRDRRRCGLCRPGGDQAGRRRGQGRLTHDAGSRPVDRLHHLAGDHQGAAADGARFAGPRRQPGPALRAGHGGHRWPGRRRCARLRRGARLLPLGGVGQGARPVASASCCSGS